MAPYGRGRINSGKGNGNGKQESVFRTFLTDPNGITVALVAYQNSEKYFNTIKHGKNKSVVDFICS